ncbi:hypothetical protein F3Y22_tig00109972pilonHSYRG00237 [Hibiscus syriacus]|uniref:Uncharacterized protein n=1 Tax=Hibiscus syriacus TaxID=106335 RepID=A0A6A3BRG7_HIBSY|nr:hypothetical protein F3Y22_tig00109972pilonHSYRG00237 [Hibiscus syriacus]
MAIFVLVVVASLLPLVLTISFALLKWNEIRYSRKKGLPPGTMGWPVLGETTEFIKSGPSFMRKQRAKYGNLFKTHILGCPTVVCMDTELNRYILFNEGKGLIPGYPESMLEILGRRNIAAVDGVSHKRIRGSMVSLIGPLAMKEDLLPKIDTFMRSFLNNWNGKTVDIQETTKEMALSIAFRQMVDREPASLYEMFKPALDKLVVGALSLPINIPGTTYYHGLQAYDDILYRLLLHSKDSKYSLTDEEIIDSIIIVLFSGYETVSVTLMMAIKMTFRNQRKEENRRSDRLEGLQVHNFTRSVIYETSRLATVVNGLMRGRQMMVLNGFTIPKGWRIYDKDYESHNYCFILEQATGCVRKGFGDTTDLHIPPLFATTYRWEEVGKLKSFNSQEF